MAQLRPQLLGDVRGQRSDHQHERLRHRPRQPALGRDDAGQVVVALGQLRDRGVEAQVLHVARDAVHRLREHTGGLGVRLDLTDRQFACRLVDDVAPDPLQQAEGADDGAGLPRARDVQRAHRHLVQAECVGAVGVEHVVGGHRVAQRLAHLPVLAGHDLAVVGPHPVRSFDDLFGRHEDTPLVAVGVSLDVPLVEQAPERLGRADMTEVEEHLVPEPRVEQVQHRVLHTADVQVDAARVRCGTRPHPVALVLRVDEAVCVRRVQVAQLVPARTRPLRHRVGLAAVYLRPVTEIERDGRPFGRAGQRRLRI